MLTSKRLKLAEARGYSVIHLAAENGSPSNWKRVESEISNPRFIGVFMLGVLSRVYRQNIYQKVDVGQFIQGYIARMVAVEADFQSLIADSGGGGVTKQRLLQKVQELFAHKKELNRVELSAMTEYVQPPRPTPFEQY